MKIQPVATAVRNRTLRPRLMVLVGAAWLALPLVHGAAEFSVEEGAPFVDQYCSTCHNDVDKEAGLDLTTLGYTPENPVNFAIWAKVHDQIKEGEMPPKEKRRPNAEARETFLQSLSTSLVTVERERVAREGRATQRRLNRYEFENALRDLFHAPWLQVKNDLPEDGQSHLFNKVGDALATEEHALKAVEDTFETLNEIIKKVAHINFMSSFKKFKLTEPNKSV